MYGKPGAIAALELVSGKLRKIRENLPSMLFSIIFRFGFLSN